MRAPFRRLLPFLLKYRRQFVLGLICVVITTTIQLLSPWVLKFAIDDLTAGVTRRKLAFYSGTLLGIACVGGVFRYLMRKILIGASRDIEYDVRNAFFVRLQQMPLAYYQARRTGDLMSRATNDLNAVRMMIGPAVMYSANTILVFVVAIVLMLSLDTRLTLMALLPLPLVSISVRYFGAAIHKRFEAIQEQLANLSAIVQEALAGVRVVRAYNQEAHEIERFRAANLEFVRRNRVLIRLQGLFFPSMTLFLGFGSLLVLWLGSRHVIRGQLTLGEFVAFNSYLVMLSWPMIAFGWVTNILQRGMASWKRMLEVLDAVPDVADTAVTAAGRTVPLTGAIEIRDLVFTLSRNRSAGPRPRVAPHRGRADGGTRRRDGLGQVDAHPPAAAPVRSAAGDGLPRRRRRPRDSARAAARRNRLRAAGAVPVLGLDCRKRVARRAGCQWFDREEGTGDRSRQAPRGRGRCPARQGRQLRSRKAMRRSSASAASRCQEARSSARPLPGP